MSLPRMCDVCGKLEASPPQRVNTLDTPIPDGWQTIGLSNPGMQGHHNGEVCSQSCAVKWIDRFWGPFNK